MTSEVTNVLDFMTAFARSNQDEPVNKEFLEKLHLCELLDANSNDVPEFEIGDGDEMDDLVQSLGEVTVDPKKVNTIYKEKYVYRENVAEYTELETITKLIKNTNTKKVIKCYYCSTIFEVWSFKTHVCYITTTTPANEVKPSRIVKKVEAAKEVRDELAEAVNRITGENLIRARRILKVDFRYDVAENGNGTGPTANTFNSKKYGPHICNLCERKFVHASGLLRHMEKHQMDVIPVSSNSTRYHNKMDYKPMASGLTKAIKCVCCGRIFFAISAAIDHIKIHFNCSFEQEYESVYNSENKDLDAEAYVEVVIKYLASKPYTNTEYDSIDLTATCVDMQDIGQYMKVVVLRTMLQCEFCEFFFSDVEHLLLHSSFHPPNYHFECIECEIYGLTAKEMSMHWQGDCIYMRNHIKRYAKNITRYFVCNVCQMKFPSLEYLCEHRQSSLHFFMRFNNSKNGILYASCEQCNYLTDNVFDMITHYEEEHSKRNKRWDKKEKSGTTKARQFLCEICGKSYTQSSHLWQHLRFHQGIKPFACEMPGCDRRFTIRPDLNDHIRKCHTGERPFHCAECGKCFLTGSVYYQHRLIHRGERRYKCDECDKRFYRADALKNHQRIHTGEKPFSCIYCTKSFRQRGDKDKHIRARHSHLDDKSKVLLQMHKYHLEHKKPRAAGDTANDTDDMDYDMTTKFDMSSETMRKLNSKLAALGATTSTKK